VRAVVFDGYGQQPYLADVPDPSAPPGGVVVRVGATGVCRSDWHAWQGHEPVALPHVPGHELAGTVQAVGSGVTRWQVGDRVTVPFVCGCGECEYCRSGQAQVCPHQTQPGFTGPGSWAEFVVLHAADTNLVALPDTVDFVTAAALGCRFATAYHAVTERAGLRAGEWIAVHGCGGVGLSAIMIAVALGARVVAVDVSEPALALARELGAEHVVDSGRESDAAAAITELTGGGTHVSMDAIGSAAVAVASVRCLRRRGRHVQVGLLHGPASTPALPMDLVLAQELTVAGSHGMPARDYPAMVRLLADGVLQPQRLISQVIGLDAAPAALVAMNAVSAFTGIAVIDPAAG
jgi:alcohol dehydrogenase